jgi:MFS superfamily sulfate permease-like transporter
MTTDAHAAENTSGIRRYIPILSWLPRYDRSWLSIDLIAGLTLWGLAVPERRSSRAS